jgi:cytosine/adenosine deaminase-related metal-dependent hydrolase
VIDLPEGDDFVLEAAWFWSGEGEPVQNVAIEVINKGVIADIRPIRCTKSRLAVIPPLVNSHTHLELSDVPSAIPAGRTFPDWIRKVIAHRAEREDECAALAAGLTELKSNGTVFAADTVPMGQEAANCSGFDVTNFIEYIGLTDDRVNTALEHAKQVPLGFGISPHAPYSVRFDLLSQLIELAATQLAPVMMHLAETREELQLLEHGSGPFADMLQAFGIWEPRLFPKHTVCDYIDCLSQANRILLAHGNYLGDREIDLLATKPNTTIVFCPRTHHHFGHTNHPWRKLMSKGIDVALGTDSRASNPDLSVWNEAKFLVEHHGCEPLTAVRLATTHGHSPSFTPKPLCVRPNGPAMFSVLEAEQTIRDFTAEVFSKCVPINAYIGSAGWIGS